MPRAVNSARSASMQSVCKSRSRGARANPPSQIFRDQLEVAQRRLPPGAGCLERSFEAVADMIVDQRLLGVFDGALHGLQLLGDRSTGASLLDHRDDRFEVTVGSLETPRDRAMWVVHDSDLLSSRQDSSDPPRRIAD